MKNEMTKGVAVILLCTVCLLSFVSCGNASENAEEALRAMMTDFQTGERDKVVAYYNSEILQPLLGEEPLSDAIIATLKNMTYEIQSVEEIDGRHVNFTVVFSMLDSSAVMEQYVQKVMDLIASPAYQEQLGTMDKDMYQQMLREEMAEVLSQTPLPMTEKETVISMEKVRGNWQIADPDAELPKLLFANLAQAVSALM